jgi:rubrerythrin
VAGGIKELYKSMSSSLTGGINNSTFGAAEGGFGYSSIKFYCMNCGYEHKKDACPKCGSKAVRAG